MIAFKLPGSCLDTPSDFTPPSSPATQSILATRSMLAKPGSPADPSVPAKPNRLALPPSDAVKQATWTYTAERAVHPTGAVYSTTESETGCATKAA